MIASSTKVLLTASVRFLRSTKPLIVARHETQHLHQCRPLSTTFALRESKEEAEFREVFEYVKPPTHPNLQHKKPKPPPKTTDKRSASGDVLVIDEAKAMEEEFSLPHPIWSPDEADAVKVTHRSPVGMSDKMAYGTIMFVRKSFDILSGYSIGKHLDTVDERTVLSRCIFLETVAGVPGFAAAMIRHLHSLRSMDKDHGWIHTLLEEAENERMHLMTFMQLRRPGPFFRYSVIATQWIFTLGFSFTYLFSPSFCHRFVGYLEEQAVVTYTSIIKDMDDGKLPMLKGLSAPDVAIVYWQLPEDAMMRDVFLAIRADEAHHRIVNHTLGSMDESEKNPFKPGA